MIIDNDGDCDNETYADFDFLLGSFLFGCGVHDKIHPNTSVP